MQIQFSPQQVDLITDLIYTQLGDVIMKSFAEKISCAEPTESKGFSSNPFLLSK
jgi:hypothetical protein